MAACPDFVANVYCPQFGTNGATGNGFIDDTLAINEAAASLSLLGGKLYLPRGTFLISSTIMLPSNVVMTGDGPGNTILIASNSFVGQPTKIGSGPSNALVGNAQMANASAIPVQSNCYVMNMTINGNGAVIPKQAANPGGSVFFRQVYGCGTINVEIVNSPSNGVEILGQDNPNLWPGNNINFRIENCHINLNYNPNGTAPTTGTFPILARGAGIGKITGNTTGELNVTHTNDSCDFPGCPNVTCSLNKFYYGGDGIGCNAADGAIITDNLIWQPGGIGIGSFSSGGPAGDPIGCNNITITGNQILGIGAFSGSVGRIGIRCSSPTFGGTPTQYALVADNLITFASGATGPNGIHIECNYAHVHDNTIDMGNAASVVNGILVDSSQGGGNYADVHNNTVRNGFSGNNGIVMDTANAQNNTGSSFRDNTVQGVTNPWVPLSLNNMIGCYVRGNSFNSSIGAIPSQPAFPGASPSTTTNPSPYDCQVVINGQVLTALNINGVAISGFAADTASSVIVTVPANGTIGMTFATSTGSWKWIAL